MSSKLGTWVVQTCPDPKKSMLQVYDVLCEGNREAMLYLYQVDLDPSSGWCHSACNLRFALSLLLLRSATFFIGHLEFVPACVLWKSPETMGLFDAIGALRVAVDALGWNVQGHVSVECGDFSCPKGSGMVVEYSGIPVPFNTIAVSYGELCARCDPGIRDIHGSWV